MAEWTVAGEPRLVALAPFSAARLFERRPSSHEHHYGAMGPRLDTGDRRALTRLCLFPARFLSTAWTGEVVSNDPAAMAYYASHHEETCNDIIRLALALRHEPSRTLLATEPRPYYGHFAPAPTPAATIPLLLAGPGTGGA